MAGYGKFGLSKWVMNGVLCCVYEFVVGFFQIEAGINERMEKRRELLHRKASIEERVMKK